jgi:hypothetical protein
VSRTRTWLLISYPESSDADKIVSALIPNASGLARSPLHDSDKNETGELKKAHYHWILRFKSVKSRAQIENLCKPLGIARVEECVDLPGSVFYLNHRNAPDKAQYSEPPKYWGIFDFESAAESVVLDTNANIILIQKLIRSRHIYSYAELSDIIFEEFPELIKCLLKNGTHFRAYQRSCTWERSS